MFFTQDDYKKIQQWLIKNSVKDTEFNEANIPFNGEETITIVQGNQNKKVFLKDLIAQVFNLGISDFVNITDKYDAPNISLEEAIRLIPSRARKEGQIITFLDREDHWHIYQFKGVLNQWNVLDTWEDLFDWEKLIIDSILPDEEDLTKSLPDANGNSYLSLKDREYNPEDFSGLGRVILRKNIVEIEDPIYGKVKKNVLYQDMMNKSNTIYEIRYDFDLNGAEITIPEGCVLDFQGGSLSNGILIGNNTCIKADAVKIFSNIRKKKTWNIDYIYLEWFGAIGDGIKDSTKEIQEAFDFADSGIINITNYDESAQYSLENTIFFYIKAKGGTYNINSTIKIPIKVNIDFNYSTIIPAIDGDYYEYRDWKYIFINNVNDNGTFIRNYISNDGVIKNLKVGKAKYYINKLGVLLTGAPIQMYNVSTTNLYPIYSTLLYTGGCYLDGIIIDNVKMVAEVETDSLPENPPLGYIVDKRSYGDYIKFTNIVGTQNRKNIKAVKLEHTHGGEISNSVQCSLYCVDCTAINFHSNHLEEYSNLIIYSSEVNINSCFFWSQENSLIVIGSQEGTDTDIPYNRSSVTINNCCIQVRRDRPITNNTSDIAIYTKSGSTCTFNNVKRLISGRTSIGYERTGFLYKDVSNNKIYANTLQQGILKPVDGKISEIGTLNEINLDINDYTIEAITEKSNFSTLKSGIYSYDFYIIANDDLKIRKKISFDINVNEGERVVVKINKKLPFGAKFYINRKFEDIEMMANLPISYTSILSDCGNDINGILWSSGNINKAQGIIGNSAIILGKNNNYTIFNADSDYFPEGIENTDSCVVVQKNNPERKFTLLNGIRRYYTTPIHYSGDFNKTYLKILNLNNLSNYINTVIVIDVQWKNKFAKFEFAFRKTDIINYIDVHCSNSELYFVSFIKDVNGNIYIKSDITTDIYYNITYKNFLHSYGNIQTYSDIEESQSIPVKYYNVYRNEDVRPTNIMIGEIYFDKKLNKPIWWTGSKWVDATGADV